MASKNSSAGLKLGYVLAPVCAVLVACGLVGLYVYSKRRRREVDESDPLEDSLIDGERFHPQSTKDAPVPNDEFAPNQSSTSTLYSSALTSHGTVDRSTWLRSSGSSFDEDFSSGSNNTLKILLNSDVLVGQRIPYESIYFQQALSKGASGEVPKLTALAKWRNSRKRLNSAPAEHRVVRWRGLEQPKQPGHGARVLPHGRPAIVSGEERRPHDVGERQNPHRRRNWMCAPVSPRSYPTAHPPQPQVEEYPADENARGKADRLRRESRLSGTLDDCWRWNTVLTAPEILEGNSLRREKPKPFQILAGAMAGELRPSFLDLCPSRILRIGTACCQHDPAKRPTAEQVVAMLQATD
ncbi:hypothetical protein ON010_g5074 [Phytophthora cinnamomi]|nr:hypothetical protein ON010_g5074 [Phytophthora cinnamomi]